MLWLISIVLIIILYLCINWLYNKYKEDRYELDKQLVHIQIKIGEIERKNKMNEELINWLYITLQKKAILNKEDNRGDNND